MRRAWGWIGWIACALALAAVYVADRPLWGGERVELGSDEGVRLAATYTPGDRPAGVLLLEGFGSDQVAMRGLAAAFAREGVHVLRFDFTGHGRSGGGLGFDNAQTDLLARQALRAAALLRARAGLAGDQILLIGHSMGARVALQAAAMGERVGGLVLLGAQVNLLPNVQSELFTGVQDADLAWVQSLGPARPDAPILLLSGMWDDVLPPAGARALHERLGGEDAEAERTLVLLPALLHNYEVYSPRALSRVKAWAGEAWGMDLDPRAPGAALRIGGWLVALGGLFAGLAGLRLGPEGAVVREAVGRVRVVNVRRFLWAKLALWAAAVPLMAICVGAFFLVPLPLPAFNIYYVGFIGGYGLLMLLLYGLGRVPGAQGRLSFAGPGPRARARWPEALALAGGTFALLTLFVRSGWFYAPPAGARMGWLLLFTPPTALGFRIGAYERRMLDRATHKQGNRRTNGQRRERWGPGAALTWIGLLPFVLWTAFQLAIGSVSGAVGGLQGLIILALALQLGDRLRERGLPPWPTAVVQSVLLYWLVLPQGALFAL